MKLLIDGDVLAYRAGFATEKTKYLVTDAVAYADKTLQAFENAAAAKQYVDGLVGNSGVIWSRKESEPEDKALMILDVMIGDIRARYADQDPSLVVFLSGVGNFRNAIATRATYKGNREGAAKPKHFRAIRDHLATKWGAVLSSQEEADDLIAIAATAEPDSIICSVDKDLMQLPGKHYDFVKKEETIVSPKEAVVNFYAQVIAGDSVDNVPGATGFGQVRARKALAEAKSPLDCWQIALGIYVKEFGDISGPLFALEAARLVYVRRLVDDQWNPPTSEAKTPAPQRIKKASRR